MEESLRSGADIINGIHPAVMRRSVPMAAERALDPARTFAVRHVRNLGQRHGGRGRGPVEDLVAVRDLQLVVIWKTSGLGVKREPVALRVGKERHVADLRRDLGLRDQDRAAGRFDSADDGLNVGVRIEVDHDPVG